MEARIAGLMSKNKYKILTNSYLILCTAGQDNYYDKTCLHKVINQFISILTVCAAHAHAELSVKLCLAAFMYPVQQLFFATVMTTLQVMSLGSELVSTKFTGQHSLNVELQSLDS